MYLDRIFEAGPDTDLIAPDAGGAALWETEIARVSGLSLQTAWPSPPILPFRQWLREQFEAAAEADPALRDRGLLSSLQTSRLWQRVIDESGAGAQLISSVSVAGWARDTARKLYQYGAAPDDIPSDEWKSDSSAFPAWHRRYQNLLREHGWIDPDQLLYTLNRSVAGSPVSDLIWLDPPAITPEVSRLNERWTALGRQVGIVRPDGHKASVQALMAASSVDELKLMIDWVARQLAIEPCCRLAVICPDLDSRRDEFETTFSRELGSVALRFPRGFSVADSGLFGSAVSALRLITPGADFSIVSRWLRSPYFADQQSDYRFRASRLERQLRSDPRLQRDFGTAYRQYGLRGELLRQLPEAAAALDSIFERLPRRATPTAWAQVWQSCLRLLDWHGFSSALNDSLRSSWDNAWARFAELTPVIGSLDCVAALREFEHLLGQETSYERMRPEGVHFFDSIRDVGPGYAGVWHCGFADRVWPQRVPANPLLRREIRKRLGMPGADSATDLAQANVELEYLLQRAPQAVFSCPLRVLDQPQVPNPRFNDWTKSKTAAAAPAITGREGLTAEEIEVVPDPAPSLAATIIPGGARTLDLQSACPVRAFISARLGAEPLESPVRGIDPRLRGIVLHRALELLFAHKDPKDRTERLEQSVNAALEQLVPGSDLSWMTQIEAERIRTLRVIEALLDTDTARDPFTVTAREQPTEIELAGCRLRCRVDRIDQLGDGQCILLDYKTGRVSVSDWFGERPGNLQLPLYTMAPEPTVAAIALVTLSAQRAEYRAAGPAAKALPGRHQLTSAEEWDQQLGLWREQLTSLAEEFRAGDVRIRLAGAEQADGPYAALTRIRSLLQ